MDSSQKGLTLEIIIIGMTVVFILALALIIFFIIYKQRLLKQENIQRVLELEYQKDLLKASIAGQEKERLRVAKELHDDVGAMLTTTKVYFEQFSSAKEAEKQVQLNSKMNQLLGGMIESVRSISHDLRPMVLEKLGLIEAVQTLSNTLNESGKLSIEFNHDGKLECTKDQELNLYRIIQELITNTLKHSQAKLVQIQLSTYDNTLDLLYRDDGIGMDATKSDQKKGIGLKNIESRLSLMSGTIKYLNKNSGFYVEILLDPLKPLN